MKSLLIVRSILPNKGHEKYILEYNFPMYIIELANALDIKYETTISQKELIQKIRLVSVTNNTLKSILESKDINEMISHMNKEERYKKLSKMILKNSVCPMFGNGDSYLSFDVYCNECKSIGTCNHSFLCSIKSEENEVVGYVTSTEISHSTKEQNIFIKSNTTEDFIRKKERELIDNKKPNTPISVTTNNDIKRNYNVTSKKVSTNNEELTPMSSRLYTSNSGSYEPPIVMKNNEETNVNGILMKTIINRVETSKTVNQVNCYVITTTQSCEVLQLVSKLRKLGLTVRLQYHERITYEEVKNMYALNNYVYCNQTFRIKYNEEEFESKTYEEAYSAIEHVVNDKKITIEDIEFTIADINTLLAKEESNDKKTSACNSKIIAGTPIIAGIIVSPYNKEETERRLEDYTQLLRENDQREIGIILSSVDNKYIHVFNLKREDKKN